MTARKTALMAVAVAVLASALGAASASDLKNLYDPIVRRVAGTYGIDAGFIHAVIRAESNYDSFALSEKGAMGLMQLMPETAEQYGVRNVFDAAQNIEGGVKYLKDLVALFKGDTRLVLAAYNAGQEAVKRYGTRIPPYQETRDYISRVMASYAKPRLGRSVIKLRDASGKVILTNDPSYFGLKND